MSPIEQERMMLDRLKNALRAKGPSGALREALLPLKAHSADLYERAVAYVDTGAQAVLLLDLEQAKNPELENLLASPARMKSWVTTPTGKTAEALKAVGVKPGEVQASRSRFYGSPATPEQFVRFGTLLTAIATEVNRTVQGVPTWLTALLNDVAATFTAAKPEVEAVAKRLPAWRPEFVETLAKQAELPDPEVTTLLALCQRADIWGNRLEPHKLPGMDEYLATRGRLLTPSVAARLNADARAFLAERAEHVRQVRDALAPVIAAFTVDSAKGVRTVALRGLSAMTPELRAEVVPGVFAKAPAARAGELVEWLGRDAAGAAMLADAVAAGARIGSLVEQAAQRREVIDVDLPEVEAQLPSFEPLADQAAGAAVIAELRRALDTQISWADGASEEWKKKAAARARAVTAAELDELVEVANGRAAKARLTDKYNAWWVMQSAPSLNLIHTLRLCKAANYGWYAGAVRSRAAADTDLRVIADALQRAGLDLAPEAFLDNPVCPEAAWPYFAGHVEVLERWLTESAEYVTRALSVLACFPALPKSVLPKVAAVALGDSRTNRPLAQAALLGHPAAPALAEQGLRSTKGEIRAAAADWLARQGDPAAIGLLRTTLAKEKRELVRAALLAALEVLGDDISGDLAPSVLLAEATKGLKAARPASMAWFSAETLPAVRWRDGTEVEPSILSWWFVLAVKLKEPDGTGLIDRYLSRLDPADAAEVGRHALRSWIAQDTRHPSEAESRAYAAAEGPRRWQANQRWLANVQATNTHRHYAEEAAAVSVEDRTAEAFREHQANYLGSATADKGMLALTTRMPGIELANCVQAYIRNHGGRRAQVEYLVTALYANGQPAAVQLLLSISRRFKQASVQAKALDYVQRIADASGWTPEELADRTIPTAGFGEDRLLHLDFGSREFLGRIGAKATIELSDAEGKPIKALPSPRASDDEELAAEAKKQLTTSRKELKAVLTQQTARLYEGMCGQRSWAVADWREYLASHPLVSQLITRLIWIENPGEQQRTFRPTEDGELIGADDEPLELAADARIELAHRVLLPHGVPEVWRQHLVDYAVEPLFDQLSASLPEVEEGATEVADLRGHLTDTFSFRGVAGKRGYSRGGAEDGGWFSEYTKTFSSAGLVAVLEFTGSYLPEENIACATEALRFTRRGRPVLLAEVPPVLLAECYADYAALAALGPYDPDYQKKSAF